MRSMLRYHCFAVTRPSGENNCYQESFFGLIYTAFVSLQDRQG